MVWIFLFQGCILRFHVTVIFLGEKDFDSNKISQKNISSWTNLFCAESIATGLDVYDGGSVFSESTGDDWRLCQVVRFIWPVRKKSQP